ncbi:MAG TPA: hypothetical protein VIT20_05775 [Propionibacteriaceae bacterium]
MSFQKISADDVAAVTAATDILEAARLVDDPSAYPFVPEIIAGFIAYGFDLDPNEHYLYWPEGLDRPVGLLEMDVPERDNRHLAVFELTVHPDHRAGEVHRAAMLAEAIRIARAHGRTTMWTWGGEDDGCTRDYLTGQGFTRSARDARRHQVLADVDPAAIDLLWDEANAAAVDYELIRMRPPLDDELLAELAVLAAAINDAPMGDLTYEDELYDARRMSDQQTAGFRRGDRRYRVVARHRTSGEMGGHSEVAVHPVRPHLGHQADTAVARAHRGHRLGLLLKIDMMRWLAETEPGLEVIETFNNADNDFMVSVNEALGYRLSRIFTTYELALRPDASAPPAGSPAAD